VVALPLFAEGRLLGVLAFCWGYALALDEDDLGFLGTLADQCGLAIERANLLAVAEREIAERKASEAELRQANARKDDFLAMLAHELRNPLAPIRSAADLLATAELEGRLAKVPDILSRQVDHMKHIVDDLLDVSRIARGRVTLALETIDLVELVRATGSDHAPSFAQAGVLLSFDIPATPLWVRADSTRMSQAIANLLHNALKFTPKGRAVSVTLRSEAASGAGAVAERAVVEIRDDGVGISAELLGRLFEPFAQGDRTLARSSGGLGLGLAIVHGLVSLHGGSVSAMSDGENRGATFVLSLPLAEPPAPLADASSRDVSGAHARSVLIVEDNEDVGEMLALLVSTLGHEARVARSATDALAVLEQWEPEVILSDLGLPDLDGYQLARRIRSQAGSEAPLLVAVSGYGSPDDRARTREAGFHHHVTKPVDAATLAALLGAAPRLSAAARP
jgi:signal transduction histidine kinase/ActR/RegA family two-component response regulator